MGKRGFVTLLTTYGMLFAECEKKKASNSRELEPANCIQTDMLPKVFPAFPDRSEFDIYGSMTPAKEDTG